MFFKGLMGIFKFRLFLKIPMGYASSDFSAWFRLEGKLCKMFAIILSTKCTVFKLQCGTEIAALQAPSLHVPLLPQISDRNKRYPNRTTPSDR